MDAMMMMMLRPADSEVSLPVPVRPSSPTILKKGNSNSNFWKHANQYTSKYQDELFVGEIAYVMVTLHRTGA